MIGSGIADIALSRSGTPLGWGELSPSGILIEAQGKGRSRLILPKNLNH